MGKLKTAYPGAAFYVFVDRPRCCLEDTCAPLIIATDTTAYEIAIIFCDRDFFFTVRCP